MRREPHFDPLGDTEPNDTVYTLTVRIPPRPPPDWVPALFTRKPVEYKNKTGAYIIMPDDTNPNLDCFEPKHLDELPVKKITIKSAYFPPDMHCKHMVAERFTKKDCDQGCYFLEKGGEKIARWYCKRSDCEGHVYCGPVIQNADGVVCFGKKGHRMVGLKDTW